MQATVAPHHNKDSFGMTVTYAACVQPPPLAVNVMLPAFATERCAVALLMLSAGTCCMAPAVCPQLSTDIFCPQSTQQQTHHTVLSKLAESYHTRETFHLMLYPHNYINVRQFFSHFQHSDHKRFAQPIQTGLCLLMSLSTHLHGMHLDAQYGHTTSIDIITQWRGLVIGFCGQPHYCYRPYYLTARF